MNKTICELFAGVGGFRLGFERLNRGWNTVWFSQWEPSTKKQWAHDCYVQHFGGSIDNNGEYHTCEDITFVDKTAIPDHTLLVGGFPCQDYSVAHTLGSAHGIEGKKGVLWWQIVEVIKAKSHPFCLFENVDRLLKSPAKQKGRDFGIMLSCLHSLGYDAEWRVINAADYGAAQRRKRIFIFAWRRDTRYAESYNSKSFLFPEIPYLSMFQRAFPTEISFGGEYVDISEDLLGVSDRFTFNFMDAGGMLKGRVFTCNFGDLHFLREENATPLKSILQHDVGEKYFLDDEKFRRFAYLKGAKKLYRTSASGHRYTYSEGRIPFPDVLDKPARTMLTSEATINRSTHVVHDLDTDRLRLLTPVEAERLNGFDDEWTKTSMSERMRYFCMGNALVVPVVTRIAEQIDAIVENETFAHHTLAG